MIIKKLIYLFVFLALVTVSYTNIAFAQLGEPGEIANVVNPLAEPDEVDTSSPDPLAEPDEIDTSDVLLDQVDDTDDSNSSRRRSSSRSSTAGSVAGVSTSTVGEVLGASTSTLPTMPNTGMGGGAQTAALALVFGTLMTVAGASILRTRAN
jgi:hypothetical protein